MTLSSSSFLQKYSNGMRRIDVAPFVNYGTRHRPQLQILSAWTDSLRYIKQILPPHPQINACLHLNMYCISRVHVLLCSLYLIWIHIEALNKLGKCRCKAELSWTKCTFRLHLYIGEAFIKYFTCKAQSMHCKVNAAFSMLQNKIN